MLDTENVKVLTRGLESLDYQTLSFIPINPTLQAAVHPTSSLYQNNQRKHTTRLNLNIKYKTEALEEALKLETYLSLFLGDIQQYAIFCVQIDNSYYYCFNKVIDILKGLECFTDRRDIYFTEQPINPFNALRVGYPWTEKPSIYEEKQRVAKLLSSKDGRTMLFNMLGLYIKPSIFGSYSLSDEVRSLRNLDVRFQHKEDLTLVANALLHNSILVPIKSTYTEANIELKEAYLNIDGEKAFLINRKKYYIEKLKTQPPSSLLHFAPAEIQELTENQKYVSLRNHTCLDKNCSVGYYIKHKMQLKRSSILCIGEKTFFPSPSYYSLTNQNSVVGLISGLISVDSFSSSVRNYRRTFISVSDILTVFLSLSSLLAQERVLLHRRRHIIGH
jgi:hypothetical protein